MSSNKYRQFGKPSKGINVVSRTSKAIKADVNSRKGILATLKTIRLSIYIIGSSICGIFKTNKGMCVCEFECQQVLCVSSFGNQQAYLYTQQGRWVIMETNEDMYILKIECQKTLHVMSHDQTYYTKNAHKETKHETKNIFYYIHNSRNYKSSNIRQNQNMSWDELGQLQNCPKEREHHKPLCAK